MALADGYLFHVVARLGVEADIPAMIMGEFGFDTDTQTMRVGNDTTRPVKIPTDRSTGDFDMSRANKWIMPGGLTFDKNKPGAIDGVNIGQLNQANGFLVRRGDNTFGATAFRSSDQSLIIVGGGGTQGTIDLRINPDSDLIRKLFEGIGVLTISSIRGLQEVLDELWAAITAARDAAISTVRGAVPAEYNTLEKLYKLINANVIVVGDPSGVVEQVIRILRDGVRDNRNTLKKISDDLDGVQADIVQLKAAVAAATVTAFDPFWINLTREASVNTRLILGLINRANKDNGSYKLANEAAAQLIAARP